MKKVVFAVIAVALVFALSSLGCATKVKTTPSTQNVTGVLQNVSANTQAGQPSITIQNPQGQTTLPVASNTSITINGVACTVDQLAALQLAGNVSYNCTTVYYIDDNGQTVTVGVNVTKIVP